MLTLEEIKKLLVYDRKTGVFSLRNPRKFRKVKAPTEIGYKSGKYIKIKIERQVFYAHRLAWAYCRGAFPNGEIDHKNHDGYDNRICNLREVTRVENSRNLPKKMSASGHTGVRYRSDFKKWTAQITVSKKLIYIGSFKTLREAVAARKRMEKQNGFHKNHGEQ